MSSKCRVCNLSKTFYIMAKFASKHSENTGERSLAYFLQIIQVIRFEISGFLHCCCDCWLVSVENLMPRENISVVS